MNDISLFFIVYKLLLLIVVSLYKWSLTAKEKLDVTCAFLLQENAYKLSGLITFKPRKTTISSTLFIRQRF